MFQVILGLDITPKAWLPFHCSLTVAADTAAGMEIMQFPETVAAGINVDTTVRGVVQTPELNLQETKILSFFRSSL